MKAATVNELKRELVELSPKELHEITLRLAKYKKENKELLTYLLFEAHDEAQFIQNVKDEIDAQFAEMNRGNIYYVKKSVRKILRLAAKYIKYSGQKQTEVEILIHCSAKIKRLGVPASYHAALEPIRERQIIKIAKSIKALHEDLQYDYEQELRLL